MLLLHNLCVAAVLVLTCDLCFQGNTNCCWTQLLWQKSSWVLRPPENHRARVAAECRWLKWWTVDVTDARGIFLVQFCQDLGRQVTYAGSILGLVWNSKKKKKKKKEEEEEESNWKNKFCPLNPAGVLESWFFFSCGKGHACCKSHCLVLIFSTPFQTRTTVASVYTKDIQCMFAATTKNIKEQEETASEYTLSPCWYVIGKGHLLLFWAGTLDGEKEVFGYAVLWPEQATPFTKALSLLVKSSHSLDLPCMVVCNFVS